MSEKQETIADIAAEMRGARTEFPFVYLMGEPDTPEVIDSETKEIIEPRKINIRRVTVKELADRIERAKKREVRFSISVIRAKLYGAAAGLHALAARSDARQRGISYTVVQEIADEIEYIADEGGKE